MRAVSAWIHTGLFLIAACGGSQRAQVRSSVDDAERVRLSQVAPQEAALAIEAERVATEDVEADAAAMDEYAAVAHAYWQAAREESQRRSLATHRGSLEPELERLTQERRVRDVAEHERAEQARLELARSRAIEEANAAIARAEREETRARRRYATNDPESARHAAEVLIDRVRGLIAQRRVLAENGRDFAADEQTLATVRGLLASDPVRALAEIDRLRRSYEASR